MRRLALVLLLGVVGCSEPFDPPSKIDSLRVMAVKKTAPYAKPGEEVTVSMLWHDGSPAAPRPIQRAWLTGCVNPPGDLYYACFNRLQDVDSLTNLPPGIAFTEGDSATFTVPSDIISSRPAFADPNQPPFGMEFVFFFACAGNLVLATPEDRADSPIACADSNGAKLGADDFTVGYASVLAYDQFRNNNPAISGFSLNGQELSVDCIGEACLADGEPDPIDCTTGDARCVPTCSENGGDDCPEIRIKPIVPETSIEVNDVVAQTLGTTETEQIWVNYYADRGGIKRDSTLLNNPDSGFNRDYGSAFLAPRSSGPVTLWATVHDSRGGAEWVRVRLQVE